MFRFTSVTSLSGRNISFSSGVAVFAVLVLAPLFGWALAAEAWFIAGALALVALTPLFVRWPVVTTLGLYALLVSSFDSLPLVQGAATLSRPAGAMCGGVLLVAGLMERRLCRPPSAALWWGLLVLWGVLSAGWALDPDMTLRRLSTVLSVFFLYLVTVSFRPTRRELYTVCALTVVGGAMAAGAAYFYGLDAGAAGRGRVVVGDFDSNPNHLGRILMLPLALAIAGFVGSRGLLLKGLAVGCVGIIGVGIYISMSRAAILAMIVMMSVLLYRMKARKQVVAASIVLLALMLAVPDKFFDRMGRTLTGADATGSGRTEIWQLAMNELHQFWLFGAGLHNFPAAVFDRGAHNSYLAMMVELGIIGLMLMLVAIGSQLVAVHNARRAGHGGLALAALEAATYGLLTGAMFGDRIWSKSMWLAWALLTWAMHSEKSSRQLSNRALVGRTPDPPLQHRV